MRFHTITGFIIFALTFSLEGISAPAPSIAGQPSPPTVQEIAAAKAIANKEAEAQGRAWDTTALLAIIEARDVERFRWYEGGFRMQGSNISRENREQPHYLPDEFEQIIIQHYNDPIIGSYLRAFLAASWCKYRSRTLFNLLYDEMKSGHERPSSYPVSDSIMQTDLEGIEAPLLDILQTKQVWQSNYNRQRIIAFMGKRKYEPAIPIFKRLYTNSPGNAESAAQMDMALVAMATPSAMKLLWWRVDQLRKPGCEPNCDKLLHSAAHELARLPVGIAPDYNRFRTLLPTELSIEDKKFLLWFLKSHPDPAAAQELLTFLPQAELWAPTMDLLINSGSTEIWNMTRKEVERLKQNGALDQGRYRYATTRLDDLITHPEKFAIEKQELVHRQEFNTKKGALSKQSDEASKLRHTDPVRYIESYAGYLKATEMLLSTYTDLPEARVGYRDEIANDYLNLAHFTRFAIRQPARAITFYDAASRLGNSNGVRGAADTYQFDLHDSAKAIAAYQKLLDQPDKFNAMNDLDPGLALAWQKWLTAQIAFLKDGTTFHGSLGHEPFIACAIGGDFTVFRKDDLLTFSRAINHTDPSSTNGNPTLDPIELRVLLESLPPSSAFFSSTASLAGALPSANAILDYFHKHDPAGYATACFFAMSTSPSPELNYFALQPDDRWGIVSSAEAKDRIRAAAKLFFKTRGISVNTVSAKPDKRFDSPEQTWSLFISSLRSGDIETALLCINPDMQAKFHRLFTSLSKEQLKAMADSFSGFKISGSFSEGIQEAIVYNGKVAAFVYFSKETGAWKIVEM